MCWERVRGRRRRRRGVDAFSCCCCLNFLRLFWFGFFFFFVVVVGLYGICCVVGFPLLFFCVLSLSLSLSLSLYTRFVREPNIPCTPKWEKENTVDARPRPSFAALLNPVKPSTAQFTPLKPSTTQYNPIKPSKTQ